MSKVIKGIKLRLYPNQSQREQLWQMFGNDRFVWNQMLGMAKERYQNNPNSLFVNEYGMNYLLKQLKCEYAFLRESDSTSFLVVNHNLAQAFKMLFRHRGGYPHFKNRHSLRQSYTGRSTCKVLARRRMQLPKLGSIRQAGLVLSVMLKSSVTPSAMNRQAVIICHCRLKLRLISCLRLVSRSDWIWASPIW